MTPEQIQQAAEKTAQENPEIMFPCVTAYETGYSAGFHAALECDTVKGMVEALRLIQGACAGVEWNGMDAQVTIGRIDSYVRAALQEYEQLIKPA